ncbi:hypothetical protein [Vulcanisaeta sp. JCM 16159]|uniref:hypothetical protein n=1 Tax=Vulcanisaeta sp. JCM 16159 TaxID=1295371 RepID=UPI0006D121C5|nr:hypothetical protein [Vulcanisaeta sp. JCM 16159]
MSGISFRAVGIRFDYLHAERLQLIPPQTQVAFNVNLVIGPNAVVRGDLVEIPFSLAASSSPSIVSISIRGALILQGDPRQLEDIAKSVNSGKSPQIIQMMIGQYVFFEVNLLLKELGIPPAMPIVPPPQQQRQGEGTTMYA